MLLLSGSVTTALLASAPPTTPSRTLRSLYEGELAGAAARKEQADKTSARLATLGDFRDRLWPLPVRLEPHDIPVLSLDSELTEDALAKLLSHEVCAVHVKGFLSEETCDEVTARLERRKDVFSNWNIHRATGGGGSSGGSPSSSLLAPTEVDKIGITAGEALESWDSFREYLSPSSPDSLDALLPGSLNPFTRLRAVLDGLHPQGCRLETRSGYPLPAGTFRRMTTSRGLIHADTATLLSRVGGEFSANLYVRTPPGRGAISIYPTQQYAAEPSDGGGGGGGGSGVGVGGGGGVGVGIGSGVGGLLGRLAAVTSPALLADLASLARLQSAGFDDGAQEALREALPIKHTIALSDGDLVLSAYAHGVRRGRG